MSNLIPITLSFVIHLCQVEFLLGITIPIGVVYTLEKVDDLKALEIAVNSQNNDYRKIFDLKLISQLVHYEDTGLNATKAYCNALKQGVFFMMVLNSEYENSMIRVIQQVLEMPTVYYKFWNYEMLADFSVYLASDNIFPLSDYIIYKEAAAVIYIYDSNESLYKYSIMNRVLYKSSFKSKIFLLHFTQISESNFLLNESLGTKFAIVLAVSSKQVIKVLASLNDLPLNTRDISLIFLEYLNFDTREFKRLSYSNFIFFEISCVSRKDLIKKKIAKDGKSHENTKRKNSEVEDISLNTYSLLFDSVGMISHMLEIYMLKFPLAFRNNFRRKKFYNNDEEGIFCNLQNPVVWEYGKILYKELLKIKYKGSCGEIEFYSNGTRKGTEYAIYQKSHNSKVIKIGKWSEQKKLTFYPENNKREYSVSSILNKTYIITTILDAPYAMIKESKNGEVLKGNDQFEGYCIELARLICNKIGIKYEIRPVKDGKYGNAVGIEWNGLVGEIVRGEADLSIAPLTITSQRIRVIDFSKPFMDLGISIMIKKPHKERPGIFSFFAPLSNAVWICVIFAYITISLLLYFVSKHSYYEKKVSPSNTNGAVVKSDFCLSNCFWYILGGVMQQGCELSPRSYSGRAITSFWWFFTLIIVSSYTANLAAFLTVERMNTPINGADDLAKQTAIKYGILESGSTKQFFESTTVSVYKKMWDFMSSYSPSVFVKTNFEGVKRVRNSNGKYAYLIESTTNDYINNRNPCDTMKVGENLANKGYGVGMPINSHLKNAITLSILELLENGELVKLKNKWWYDRGECGKQDSNDLSKNELTIEHFSGIFCTLLIGVIFSLLISLLEIIFKSKKFQEKRKMFQKNSREFIQEESGFEDVLQTSYNLNQDNSLPRMLSIDV